MLKPDSLMCMGVNILRGSAQRNLQDVGQSLALETALPAALTVSEEPLFELYSFCSKSSCYLFLYRSLLPIKKKLQTFREKKIYHPTYLGSSFSYFNK